MHLSVQFEIFLSLSLSQKYTHSLFFLSLSERKKARQEAKKGPAPVSVCLFIDINDVLSKKLVIKTI